MKFLISKILNLKALPLIVVLALIAGLLWFGYDYKATKDKVGLLKARAEMQWKRADSLETLNGKYVFEIENLKAERKADSMGCVRRVEGVQGVLLDLKKDRDYWKDWADKLETGEFCVEKYGLFKQKKRLVPCKNE